jgi:hypothetical protein
MTGFQKSHKPVTAILAAVVILGALFYLFRGRGTDLGKKARDMHRSAGRMMADLTREAAGSEARIFVFEADWSRHPHEEKRAWWKDQMIAFYSALNGGLEVVGKEMRSRYGEVVQGRDPRIRGGFQLADVEEVMTREPSPDVVVSFIGAPSLPESQLNSDRLPRLVCFAPEGEHVMAGMEAGLISAAILPRSTPVPYKQIKDDWFTIMYEVKKSEIP